LSIKAYATQATGHDWAGRYTVPFGFDGTAYVFLAPGGEVSYFRAGNAGLKHIAVGHSRLREGGNLLVLDWETESPSISEFTEAMLIIPWGDETLLVPRSRIHQFCQLARANTAIVPRLYLMRKDLDSQVNLIGKPALPEAYDVFWDLPAIITSITAIEGGDASQGAGDDSADFIEVTLAAGKKDHLYEGMQLTLKRRLRANVHVTEVFTSHSKAIIIPEDAASIVKVSRGDMLTSLPQ
jgi:hypothetical protein